MSGPRVICTDQDREKWLEHRTKLITSSDIGVFMGLQPSWWSFSTRQTVIESKMGLDRYDPNNNTEHGLFNEECNRLKAEKLLGMKLPAWQWLVVNDRWPHLGATPDAVAHPGPVAAPYRLLTTREDVLEQTLDLVALETTLGGCQLKSTDSPKAVHYGKRGWPKEGDYCDWITQPPAYHLPQVMTEMAIMGQTWGLLVGQLGAHNMVPWFVYYDPTWDSVMDEAEAQAAEVFRQIEAGEQISF